MKNPEQQHFFVYLPESTIRENVDNLYTLFDSLATRCPTHAQYNGLRQSAFQSIQAIQGLLTGSASIELDNHINAKLTDLQNHRYRPVQPVLAVIRPLLPIVATVSLCALFCQA